MYNDLITLCDIELKEDKYGNEIEHEKNKKDVFAKIRSIRMSEFYAAANAGLQPSLEAIIGDYRDYSGEKIVKHDGETYRVLRTYRVGRQLEITLSHKLKDAEE